LQTQYVLAAVCVLAFLNECAPLSPWDECALARRQLKHAETLAAVAQQRSGWVNFMSIKVPLLSFA
jgi:hypothetical protein